MVFIVFYLKYNFDSLIIALYLSINLIDFNMYSTHATEKDLILTKKVQMPVAALEPQVAADKGFFRMCMCMC